VCRFARTPPLPLLDFATLTFVTALPEGADNINDDDEPSEPLVEAATGRERTFDNAWAKALEGFAAEWASSFTPSDSEVRVRFKDFFKLLLLSLESILVTSSNFIVG
jgi:hypothetical protein